MAKRFTFEDRYDAVAITPSDSDDLRSAEFRGLYVGGAGNLRIENLHGHATEFKNVQAGTLLPVAFNKVLSNLANGKDKSFNATDADWHIGWATEDETPLGVPVWGLFNRFLKPDSAIYFEKTSGGSPSADLADVSEMEAYDAGYRGDIVVSGTGGDADGTYSFINMRGDRGFWQKGSGAEAVSLEYHISGWEILDLDSLLYTITTEALLPPKTGWAGWGGDPAPVLSYSDDEVALAHDEGVATVSGSALYGGAANGDYFAEGTPASSIVGLL
jgi:hypothetical protein